MSKINSDKTVDEVVSLQNQINGLKMLLDNKKKLIEKYFDYTGEKNISNNECTVYVNEKVKIDYDINELKNKLDENTFNEIIDKKYIIKDWNELKKILKKYKISSSELKKVIKIEKEINEKSIKELYNSGKINIKDIEGCYDAKVSKSISIRMKNIEKEIPVSNK